MKRVSLEAGGGGARQVCRYEDAHLTAGSEEASDIPQAVQKELGLAKQAGCGRDVRSQDVRATRGCGESLGHPRHREDFIHKM